MDAAGDLFSTLIQAVADLLIWLLELLFYVVENFIYGVLWLCRCTKFAGPRRMRKLPEETRFLIRSCMHSLLALGLLFFVVYFGWLRKPAAASEPAQAPEPTKIEREQKMIEKAKRIKDVLLPPKPQP